MSQARCSAGNGSFSAGATDNRRSGRTHGTFCSAGNFGLAELGVCALSKTYLEQLAIGELISRPSFRAPTLNPITPPGVLPTQAGTQLQYLSALDDHGRRHPRPDAGADAPCDEDCNRAAARLQHRGPILSAVTTGRRKTMTTKTSMKRFGCA